jgi:hypothetical protein
MTAASAAGLLALVFGTAAVVVALFALPQYRRLFLGLMVFTTCYVKKPFYQEVFFVNYRGVDRGFGVTLPDLFFLGFFLFMLFGGLRRRIVWLPFNSLPWFLLIAISCVSLVGSLEPFYGTFTIHKMIRCWVLYVVVVNVVRDRRDVMVVLIALAAAVCFQAFVVVWDKYITARVVSRSVGTFRHPNTLAMYTDLILPILTALFLARGATQRVLGLFAVAILAGFVCVLFTKSRAAMLLLPASLGAVVGVSILLRPTGRKFMVLGAGMVIVALIVALALPRLIRRFESAPKESAETREYFNAAAEVMARENTFGVGINLYSLALSHPRYYWHVYPDKVDVEDPEAFRESVQGQSRLGTAHHIYWLYAAETGFPGLAVFLLHIGIFWARNFWLFLCERDEWTRSIYLGLLVGVSFFHLHGLLEWIFRQTEVQYLYFILMGTMVALAEIRRVERRPRAVSVEPVPARRDTAESTR